MNLLRETVLRLTVCGFLVALCSSAFSGERLRRLIRFVGGCFLAVVVLSPILESDLPALLERLRPALPEAETSEASEKNERLLRELTEQQTEEYIEQAAQELGAELRAEVRCEKDEASGLYLPAEVTLRGFVTDEQRAALSRRLEEELALAQQRQRWVIG